MFTLCRRLPGVLLAIGLASPAWADDIVVKGKPCNTLCQSWLGVSGKPTQSPVPPAADLPLHRSPQPRVTALPLQIGPPPRPAVSARLSGKAAPDPAPDVALSSAGTLRPAMPAAAATPLKADDAVPHDAAPLEALGPADLTVPLPTLHDSAQMPDMRNLVAVRGAVMVETDADRAANARQRAALMRETRSNVQGGPVIPAARHGGL